MNLPVPHPTTVRRLHETVAGTAVPLLSHPTWSDKYPWLIQGTTWRGHGEDFDLGLSGETPVGTAINRWRRLHLELGARGIVHSRQVHGDAVQDHASAFDGIRISDGFDGHASAAPDIILTVSVADCVPVFMIGEDRRAVVLLHAGWRGIAAGIVRRGLDRMRQYGCDATALKIHFGPAICGRCYEVGPEVHERLGLAVPAEAAPVDLRQVGAGQCLAAGVDPTAVTVSDLCTRCDPRRILFSHRAGDRGRQMAVLGIRTRDR